VTRTTSGAKGSPHLAISWAGWSVSGFRIPMTGGARRDVLTGHKKIPVGFRRDTDWLADDCCYFIPKHPAVVKKYGCVAIFWMLPHDSCG